MKESKELKQLLLEKPKKSLNKSGEFFRNTSNLFFSQTNPNNEKEIDYSTEKLADALPKTSCYLGYSGIRNL